MTYPSSFCTINTQSCRQELLGMLLSLSLHHPNANMYILCDSNSKEYIEQSTPKPKLNITWFVELDKYSNLNRKQMEAKNLWSEFQMAKASVIEYSLKKDKDVLFLDSDIIVFDKIELPSSIKTYNLGVSPHYMKKNITDTYGYYNGGMLWTSCKEVPNLWKKYTKTSRFFDQASIEDLVKHHKDTYFEFGEHYNMQTWRFIHGLNKDHIKQNVIVTNNIICYKNNPLKFIHTHYNTKDKKFEEFNLFFLEKLKEAKKYKELSIIHRVMHDKWIIRIPAQPMSGQYNHANDSFRILPYLFKKHNKDVDIELSDKTGHCWLNPSVLLYDRPTLRWMNNEVSDLLLLGNGDVNVEGKEISNTRVEPWIFWARRPDILDAILDNKGVLSYDDREIESIFIGNFENPVQEKYRTSELNWENVISEYHCTKGKTYKFTQEQYLNKLRNSKYGLCMRGFGKKCHREVELMAFGTVPIITQDVNITSYYDPPVENIHYLKANTPDEFKRITNNITPDKWKEMSKACYEWYQRNTYSKNAWENMIHFILYDSPIFV